MTVMPQADKPEMSSARPEMTQALMAETGLDESILRELVHRFYTRVRADPVLGPIFDARIRDWEAHLARLVDFWSSVALMTGRYHGAPVPAHSGLPVDWTDFERWLALFGETAREVCPPRGAAHVIERAERIARSLHAAIGEGARLDLRGFPVPGDLRTRTTTRPEQNAKGQGHGRR